MDVFFIYGLVDTGHPDEFRYVGQTATLLKRWKMHLRPKQEQGWALRSWKQSVIFFGRSFEMRLIEVVYGNRDKARSRERFHISRLESLGHRLMNGECWNRRTADVESADLFVSLVASFHDLLESKTDPRLRGMVRLAGVIDRTENRQRRLMLCGKEDCFEVRCRHVRKTRRTRLDRRLVSR